VRSFIICPRIPTDLRTIGYGCPTETPSWRLSCHCGIIRDVHHLYASSPV
jgi:hypothetical protein